mgnify:CR=1 FL=1
MIGASVLEDGGVEDGKLVMREDVDWEVFECTDKALAENRNVLMRSRGMLDNRIIIFFFNILLFLLLRFLLFFEANGKSEQLLSIIIVFLLKQESTHQNQRKTDSISLN